MKYSETPWNNVFKTDMVANARFTHDFEFPILKKTYDTPQNAIPFEKALRSKRYDQWVHFFTHDRNFECLWRTPNKYLPILKRFSGIITPDYSLYREMPLAMQIWNTYRNRATAYWMQQNGISIVPNVRWSDERSYTFAFDGIPKHSVIAVSTNGCIRNPLDRAYFKKGLLKMVDTLEPSTIVNYSYAPDSIFSEIKELGIPLFVIENYQETIRKAVS